MLLYLSNYADVPRVDVSGTDKATDKDGSPQVYTRLDRLSRAVEVLTEQYQMLVAGMAAQNQTVSQKQPSRSMVENLFRQNTLRARTPSLISTLPSSPTNESIWYDAQEIPPQMSVGEELSIEPGATEEVPFLTESISSSRPHTPNEALDSVANGIDGIRRNRTSFCRRDILPAPTTGDEGSLFTALKQNRKG